jgi:23S rRNA pseudouridine1911/1915/1917 synthase
MPVMRDDPDGLPPDEEADEDAAAPSTIEQRFLVEGECHGWRLDRFLQKKMRRLSRSRIQRVIRGDCEVAGRPAKPGMQVLAGQEVRFRRPAPVEPEVPRDIRIVHEDPSFYAIDKPAGLPIHPTARYHYSTLTALLRERFPGEPLQVAHRLDRETSGLLLLGRGYAASVALKGAFARRQVHKRYLAIVHGVLQQEQVTVDQPIGPCGGKVRVRMAVRPPEAGGLPARTEVRALERLRAHTLVECLPHTGRQHQIRVHLDFLGYPIVGDKLYPDEEVFMDWADEGWEAVEGRLPFPRHALHAAGLRFPHPVTGAPVILDCPLPQDLRDLLGRL